MSTTIELTDQQAAELRALTSSDDTAAAVQTAVTEYIRYLKRMKLLELSNQIEMEDNWQALEQLELDDRPRQ
jgi:hypothetical protein